MSPGARKLAGRLVAASPRGFTFLEVILSLAMLAALLLVIGQFVVQLKRQTVSAERNALALYAVESAMEELTARPWDQINDDAIRSISTAKDLGKRWPDANFTGSVTDLSDPVEAKRISLEFTLTPDARAPFASLTTWIYRAPQN